MALTACAKAVASPYFADLRQAGWTFTRWVWQQHWYRIECLGLPQGGRTGLANFELRSVERCKMPWAPGSHDRADSSWTFCSPMCRPRTALGACAIKDRIYAVGGQVCFCCL